MKKLDDILTWKQNFGLLPIHLKPLNDDSKFVMLNGGYGDFCLQTTNGSSNPEDYFSKSWSSNTKNFVVLDNDNVKIFNWKNKTHEIASREQVVNNFEKFYNYLQSKSYRSESDIVPFIVDIFKQFRNLTLERKNPVEALNLLFILLASLEEDYTSFDRNKWNINESSIPSDFDSLTDRIKKGIGIIKPELDLIIRHSSGLLFQEAQKEVLFFDNQSDIFGGISSRIETKKNTYSSVHYTPQYLARAIVENSLSKIDLNKPSLKIFDPACGSSEFLIETLKQLRELKYKGQLVIKGWDTSETAINTSNFLLKYEQRTIWKEQLAFEIKQVTDSLTESWDNDYDIILMNPPFVSWELLNTKDARDVVRETLGNNYIGRPNQASAFFYKSILHLNDNGVIGCVIPSSLLTLDSYKKLRVHIYNLITIDLIGKLGNFVFEDALTDVSLIVGHKPKNNNHLPIVLWTANEKNTPQMALRDLRKMTYSNELTVSKTNYSIFQPIHFPIIKDSWKTISLKENSLLKTIERFVIERKLAKVHEVFNVLQGINSGNNSLFKIHQSDYLELSTSESIYFRPVIDNNAIKNTHLFNDNYIWYPYDMNGIIINSESELQQNAPVFYKKILPFKKELSKRRGKTLLNWWHLSEYRKWLLKNEPRLVSTRFGNSDSFAFDHSGKFVVENGNAWLPKKSFDNVNDYYFYLAIFSSPFFDKLLSIYSKQLFGGNWYDLGKKYSQEIPIPNVHSHDVKNSNGYNKLIEIGSELFKGNLYIRNITEDILLKYFYPEV